MDIDLELKKELPTIKTNISLKEHTSYRIGGLAKYFFEARNEDDFIKAITVAKKLNLPFFILGKGSNILVSDKGYQGLIIKVQSSRCKTQNYKRSVKFICDAGLPLSMLVQKSVESGLTGLEWAAGIPGTIGGAICGNSGAFGESIADVVRSINAFDITRLKIKKVKNEECQFAYKDSLFKHHRSLVILSGEMSFKKGNRKEILGKMKKYLKYRREKQPLDFPSAGSIFKNVKCQNPNAKCYKLLKKFSETKEFRKNEQIPAGFLIEKCGLKGKKIGNAQISEKHANFIINRGEARASDVVKLIKIIKKSVKMKFNINLKEEIQYLGF